MTASDVLVIHLLSAFKRLRRLSIFPAHLHAMQPMNRHYIACDVRHLYQHDILYVGQHVAMLRMSIPDTCLLTRILRLQDPLSEPNWSLSIRRSQVVNALESALCILSDAEEAWLAWRHASSQTETQLRRLFRSGQQQHNAHEQVSSTHIWYRHCCLAKSAAIIWHELPGMMSHHHCELSLLPHWRVWQLPCACTFGLVFCQLQSTDLQYAEQLLEVMGCSTCPMSLQPMNAYMACCNLLSCS